ncbi:hypothetical protein Tco_0874918 [Tanacetum coccineum]|uniref:Uncharacterized protein n=1 Tax=Tanacetum coccineum TaxID=301880 RepID=A0ABQ5BR02_9ASTR
MAQLKYCDKHNQVGFLCKPDESAGFAEIVDFLRSSNLRGVPRPLLPAILHVVTQNAGQADQVGTQSQPSSSTVPPPPTTQPIPSEATTIPPLSQPAPPTPIAKTTTASPSPSPSPAYAPMEHTFK